MKRKFSVIVLVAMLAVVCLGTLVACKSGLSDDKLTLLLERVEAQAKKAEGKTSYTLDRVVEFKDSDDTMVKCAVDWTSNNDGVTFKKGDDTVDVTVGEGITVYNLIGTLVKSSGKAYEIEGNPVYIPISTSGSNQGGNQGGNNQGGNNQGGNNQGGDTTKTPLEQLKEAAVSSPVAGTNYLLAMYYGTNSNIIYAIGSMSGNFIQTTDNASSAAIVTVETTTNGFYLKVGSNYVALTDTTTDAKTPKAKASFVSSASQASVFRIGDHSAVISTVTSSLAGDNDFYLGSHGSYNTLGATSTFYFTDANSNVVVDTAQWVGRLIPANTTIGGGTTGGNQGGTTTPTTPGGDTTPTGDSITLAYTAGTTVSSGLSTSTNYATYLCADYASTVTVTSTDKPNLAGLNKANQLRLYANDSQATTLTISLQGYKITSIQVTLVADEQGGKTNGASIVIGSGSAVDAHASTTITSTVNASSVTIAAQSSSGSKQVWITQILIYIEAL